jgi:hypothetical protein
MHDRCLPRVDLNLSIKVGDSALLVQNVNLKPMPRRTSVPMPLPPETPSAKTSMTVAGVIL